MSEKTYTPILAEGVNGLNIPEGLTEIGAYHGYATSVGDTDPDTGVVRHRYIILAGSAEDVRAAMAEVKLGKEFDINRVQKISAIGTDFLKFTDEGL